MPKEIAGSTEVREYSGTQYRVRIYPPFGYSILYEEYNLTRFNHRKNTTHVSELGGPRLKTNKSIPSRKEL